MAHIGAHFVSASNSLSLTDNVVGNQVRLLSASDTLVFSVNIGLNFLPEEVIHTLNFTQTVSQNLRSGIATSVLIFTDSVFVIKPHQESVFNTLSLSQTVKKNLFSESVTSNLQLSQLLVENVPIFVSASNNLNKEIIDDLINFDPLDPDSAVIQDIGLRQSVSVKHTIINKSVVSLLSLSQKAARVHFRIRTQYVVN